MVHQKQRQLSPRILNRSLMAKKPSPTAIRYWLTFSSKDIQRPLLWEMSQQHDVIYDIRSASIGPDIGVVGLELSGESKVIASAVQWLMRHGVQVDPVF